MPWDSRMLHLRAGKVTGVSPPSEGQMQDYDMVLARLPIDADEASANYQTSGFKVVTMDLAFSAEPEPLQSSMPNTSCQLAWLRHEVPKFTIEGFSIEDSRLMRDPRCRQRLPAGFWDRLIEEHCCAYADTVLCALDAKGEQLLGFISCFERETTFELFTVAVHPQQQGKGIGKAMLHQAMLRAKSNGLMIGTQVLASNVRAMDFYITHGFRPVSGELVLHRWNN